jgi:hypothetical protein
MFFCGIGFMCVYYSVFHPTGVHVDPKNLFSRRELSEVAEAKPPNFIDLREFASRANAAADEGELAAVNLSRSTSALDELDGCCSSGEKAPTRSHQVVRKTSSAPMAVVLSQQSTRTLKAMRGGGGGDRGN